MQTMVRALALGLAAVFCMGQASPDRIDYTLTPILTNGALTAVQYDVRFRGDADGESALRLPGSWGGQNELWRSIEGLSVVSGATMTDGEGPNARVLTHRPNARVHLRYRLIQDFAGAPNAEQGNAYRPVIQPTYFHLIGDASLVTPEHFDTGTPVRLQTRNMPRGWSFASDLEHGGLTLGRVWSSITVGGDFRIIRNAEQNVRVAIRGAWNFTDADFGDDVVEIIAGQRRFFGDTPSPYLVTVVQLETPNGWTSIGGTGLGDAFAFFASPNATAAPITRTLAHEGLHSWIPGEVGGMPREDEALSYWFSEGFTEFFTGRVLVREGLWTPADFARDFNATLRAYAQSSVRTEPNSRILADFWSNPEVQQLPYQRGRLLATMWDARIRRDSAQQATLDSIVLDMRERARGGDPLKAADMFLVVAPRFALDPRADLAAHVDRGEPIVLPADLFGICGRVETREVPRFHRGFDIDATQANNNIITGTDPALPAYAAGVRDGMVLIRRDAGMIGDSEQEIAYVMRDGETERTFHYMPRGHGSYTLQEFQLADDLTGDRLAQCVTVLGG